MNRDLLFLEFDSDVSHALREGLITSSTRIVCIAPGPAVALEEAGIPYIFPERYVDSKALHERWQEESYRRLEALCALIDQHIIATGWGLELPVMERAFYALKLDYDACCQKVLQLQTIFRAETPRSVHYFRDRTRPRLNSRLLLFEADSIWSELIPLVAGSFHGLAAVEISRKPRSRFVQLNRFLIREAALRWISAGVFRRHRSAATTSSKRYLLVEGDAGLKQLALQLTVDAEVVHWRPFGYAALPDHRRRSPAALLRAWSTHRQARRSVPGLVQSVRSDRRLAEILSVDGLDITPVFWRVVEEILRRILPQLAVLEPEARRFLERLRPTCIISTYFSTPLTHTIAVVGRQLGIPIVTYQHYGYGYAPYPLASYFDERMSDYKLVWGEGPAREVVRSRARGECVPVVTGWWPVEKLQPVQSGESNLRPRIVYVLTSYHKNTFYFSSNRQTCTDYFEVNRSIIRVLAQEASWADVVVRLHPSRQIAAHNQSALERWIGISRFHNVRISTEEDFRELIRSADLLVGDSLSAALLQTLMLRKKLMVYAGVYPLYPAALEQLKRIATVHVDLNQFLAALADAIQRRDFAPPPSDDGFVNEYLLPQRDGKASDRALRFLRTLGNETPAPKGSPSLALN